MRVGSPEYQAALHRWTHVDELPVSVQWDRQLEVEGVDMVYMFVSGLVLGALIVLSVIGHAWVSSGL